jgi:hypothetical protein
MALSLASIASSQTDLGVLWTFVEPFALCMSSAVDALGVWYGGLSDSGMLGRRVELGDMTYGVYCVNRSDRLG